MPVRRRDARITAPKKSERRLQTETLHPVSIDIEDQPLPSGHKQTMRITVWMTNPHAPDALTHKAKWLAAAFLERALLEIRSSPPSEPAKNAAVDPASTALA